MWLQEFLPESYRSFRSSYTLSTFKKDLIAGLTVGIISLPLAMAFAIASGVPPDRGLFTAIIAGFLISALGGSRVQVGGPTGAFAAILYGIIQKTGYEGLVLSTMAASVILILLGAFRLGSWVKYVPRPLAIGFTTGLSVLIFSSQIKDFFGFRIANLPAHFIDKWTAYFHSFSTFDPTTVSVAAGTLGFILAVRRFFPRIPWGIAAIVFATVICFVLHLPVETIHSKFGHIATRLPFPCLPEFSIPQGKLGEIIANGFSIAFLGAIESLLCCVIADNMIGGQHKSNMELIGQGVANFASVLFGGIPATGAIARTAVNVKMGAKTPVAGMIHAGVLFAVLLFFSPIVGRIPLAALSAVLIMVAWNMSEALHFIRLLKAPLGDAAILATAFLLTVLVDLTVAISAGMVLASFVFMKKMGDSFQAVRLKHVAYDAESFTESRSKAPASRTVPEEIQIYDIRGPFFFGVADLLKHIMHPSAVFPKVCILGMQHVPMIDISGIHALKEFHGNCKKMNTILILSGVHAETERALKRSDFMQSIGEERVFPHIDAALSKAERLLL